MKASVRARPSSSPFTFTLRKRAAFPAELRRAGLLAAALVAMAAWTAPSPVRAATFLPAPEAFETQARAASGTGLSPAIAALVDEAEAESRDYVQLDDMRFDTGLLRTDDAFLARKWSNGRVPYTFHADVTEANRAFARTAMTHWEAAAGVTFVERTDESNYVRFINSDGNWSYVGRQGGRQDLGMYNWDRVWVIVHELGHLLGMHHEHCRLEREEYVTVLWENMDVDENGHNFALTPCISVGPYDFDSIMHYGRASFSINGNDTIRPLPAYMQFIDSMGQRSHLSTYDIMGMRSQYPFLTAPSAPTNVTATFDTRADGIRIEWSETPMAYQFAIYRAGPSDPEAVHIATRTDLPPLLYDDTNAIPGVIYQYRLYAANDAGPSPWSDVAEGRRYLPPLPAPATVTASDGAFGDRVRVTFDRVDGATHYRVYRAAADNPAQSVPLHDWIEALGAWDDMTAQAGFPWYYWVRAAAGPDGVGASVRDYGEPGYVQPPAMTSDLAEALGADPDRRVYRLGDETGCAWWWVAAVRPTSAADRWAAYLHNSAPVMGTPLVESRYDTTVNLIVANGVSLGAVRRAALFRRLRGTGGATAEFEGSGETLTVGRNPATGWINWPAGDVAEMWNVTLNPGTYRFTLTVTNGTADLDMALFRSEGSSHYMHREQYAARSAAGVAGGGEEFIYTVTTAGTYGLCVWANDGNAAQFSVTVAVEPSLWSGAQSTDWHTPGNWTDGMVPTHTKDAIVPGNATRMPRVSTAENAYCRALSIQAGATLTIAGTSANRYLNVVGDMTVYGTLDLANNFAKLVCGANAHWMAGSRLQTAGFVETWLTGDWNVQDGADVRFTDGVLYVQGSADSWLRIHSDEAAFHRIACQKTGNRVVGFSGQSSRPLRVSRVIVQPNAAFRSYGFHPVYIADGIDNQGGYVSCQNDALVFTGPPSSPLALNIADELCDLVVRGGGTLSLAGTYKSAFRVNGDVRIENGTLAAQGVDLVVRGGWSNAVGFAGFNAGTNTVTFRGVDQRIEGVTVFNHLIDEGTTGMLRVAGNAWVMGTARPRRMRVEGNLSVFGTLDMEDPVSELETPAGGTAYAASFDMGGVLRVNGGDFEAADLVDKGLDGTVQVDGGLVTLGQGDLAEDRFDMLGDVTVKGGTLRLTGGAGAESLWPHGEDTSLYVLGGVLEIPDASVRIQDVAGVDWDFHMTTAYGPTRMRLGRNLTVARAGFRIWDGALEFFGNNASRLNGRADTVFRDLVCDKSAASLFVDTDIEVVDDVAILGGTLVAPGLMKVEGSWSNAVGAAGFSCGAGSVRFRSAVSGVLHTSETFHNVAFAKEIYGGDFRLADGVTLTALGNLTVESHVLTLGPGSRADVRGDLAIHGGAALDTSASSPVDPIEILVYGDWRNLNSGYSAYFGHRPGEDSRVVFVGDGREGSIESGERERFHDLVLNRGAAGSLTVRAPLDVRGELRVASGSLLAGTSGMTHLFGGDVSVERDGTWGDSDSTLTFDGEGGQSLRIEGRGELGPMVVNKPTNATFSAATVIPMTRGADFTVRRGAADIGSRTLACTGSVRVENGGRLCLGPSGRITLGDARVLEVQGGGRMDALGQAGALARVSNGERASHAAIVREGGLLAAEYALFEHMDRDGLVIDRGAALVEPHTFHGCTFRNGAADAPLLQLRAMQSFDVRRAVFPTRADGRAVNVSKISDAGRVRFTGATGVFAGEDYEDDAYRLVDWHSGAVRELTLAAPSVATRGGSYPISAAVRTDDLPLPPFEYRWTVQDAAPAVHAHDETNDAYGACAWQTAGSKLIGVTVSNAFGVAQAQRTVDVQDLRGEILGLREPSPGVRVADLVFRGTSTGKTYRVRYRPRLDAGGWTIAMPGGESVPGANGQTSWTDTGGPYRNLADAETLFYRIELLEP